MNPSKQATSSQFSSGEALLSDVLPTSEDVRSIGEIIRDIRKLSSEQVDQILAYQRKAGVRFGEAAIALGLVTPEDVLHALSVQFNYAYSSEELAKTSPELVTWNQPFGQQAEAFRALRTQILMRINPPQGGDATGRTLKALAVVSPNSGDGKSYFSANLAVSLAQMGRRTLIVDGDLRGPRLHEVFGVDGSRGLSSLLSGRGGDGVIKSVSGIPELFVLPAGVRPPNPLELIGAPGFGLVLHELQRRFEHVVVDTPAMVHGADASVIAARCGSALIIARKDQAKVARLQDLVQSLSTTSAQLLGVVMNEF